MRDRLTLIAAAAACVLLFSASSAFAGQLVYSDEFNGPLDTSTWANATPWNTQYTIGELEFYDRADSTVADGSLVLTSEKRATPGYSWTGPFAYTSGIATSLNRPKFSYGYFEIRAKLPKGQGIWPAFWLTNDSTLEIDGFEMLGDRPTRIYQTLHQNKQMVHSTYHDGPDYSAAFHTYAIDWQPTYVKWYIDGVLTMTHNAAMPSDGLYICLNTAVGGSWPGAPDASTVFPVRYDIDYVRVWDSKPTAPVAVADAYSTRAGVPIAVPAPGVLGNDTVTAGLSRSARAITQPLHGTLSMASDGSFTYTPYAGYSGTDSFTYETTDGLLTSAAAKVSLTVLYPGTTVVTRPVTRKKSRTSATVSGSFRVGAGSGIVAASFAPAQTTVQSNPVTLRVTVQRWSNGKWRAYSTKTVIGPASKYGMTVSLRRGTYRTRSQVFGGGCIGAFSPWSAKLVIS